MTLRPDGPTRLAVLSVHTSPLEQPGTGDAGGLNVYVLETARRLARGGMQVDVFTRATDRSQPACLPVEPGLVVRHVPAGPLEPLDKSELPAQLCAFAAGVLQVADTQPGGRYDLVHAHYWLSGQVGWLAADRWNVPLLHTMHTMARVKNAALAVGDRPEPRSRVVGEQQVVDAADGLVANTPAEAADLVGLYHAEPGRISVVPPGVDLGIFRPGGPGARHAARRRLGLAQDRDLVLFVGRIQPLKAPDVLLRAVADLVHQQPERRDRLSVAVLGGPSGNGLERPEELQKLAGELGIGDLVHFRRPTDRAVLADWYRAADVVAVPSYNESFGLVAMEAQACGTPVLAAAVGGLRLAVQDAVTGVLVPGHETSVWSQRLADLLDAPQLRGRMAAAGVRHAARFSWEATVALTTEAYRSALAGGRRVSVRARPTEAMVRCRSDQLGEAS